MRSLPWIVAALAIIACVLIAKTEADGYASDVREWRAKEDSLVSGWENSRGELAELRAYTDSLKAYTDSVLMTYPPPPIVIQRSLKFFEFAPIQQAIDSLNAQ